MRTHCLHAYFRHCPQGCNRSIYKLYAMQHINLPLSKEANGFLIRVTCARYDKQLGIFLDEGGSCRGYLVGVVSS